MFHLEDRIFSFQLIGGALLTGIGIYFISTYFIKRWHQRMSNIGKWFNVEHLMGPLRLLIPAVCVSLILPLLRFEIGLNDRFAHLVKLWVIAAFGWFLTKVVYVVSQIILSRYNLSNKDNLQARRAYTQIKVIERVINALIIILTAAFMIMTFGKMREIGMSILASAGILSVVIGFAAQKMLGNFLAGIQIALTQPIRLDDVVIVEGEWGWVEEITLTYVVVRVWDLRRLVVPISYFIEKPFQNWTRTSADLLGTVFLYVDYTVPLEDLRLELTRILQQSPRWDKKVNIIQVTDMKERVVEVRALVSAEDSSKTWDLRCEVREKLLNFLQTKYPQTLPKTRVLLDK